MKYKIIVDKQSRTNPSDEKRVYEIDIEELCRKGDVYDSLVITKDEDYVMRRLGLSEYHVLKVLDEPVKEPLTDINIELFEGDNYIYLVDMTGNRFYAEYLVKNEFNDVYITKSEAHSAINQTANQIEISVDEKLENYSTTEEVSSKISQKASEINLEVSKKVGSDEIISKINQSAEKITINAEKIDIEGKAVHFKTNISKIVGPFTTTDREKIKNYLMGTGTLTSQEKQKYDISGDGEITSADYMYIQRAINNGGYLEFSGTYEIDPFNKDKNLALYDSKTNRFISIISLVHNYFRSLYVDGLEINGQLHVINNVGEMFTQENNNIFELYVNGAIRTTNKISCSTLDQTSVKSKKKYIRKLKNSALDLIKNSDICLYNLKSEQKGAKQHIRSCNRRRL